MSAARALGHRSERISDAHAAILRRLVATTPLLHVAQRLGTSQETVMTGVTGGTFLPATRERLERAIDGLATTAMGKRGAR